MAAANARALRQVLFDGLRADFPSQSAYEACLVPQSAAEYALPAFIGDYTDFYSSIHHATAVGRLFRPEQPLLPIGSSEQRLFLEDGDRVTFLRWARSAGRGPNWLR